MVYPNKDCEVLKSDSSSPLNHRDGPGRGQLNSPTRSRAVHQFTPSRDDISHGDKTPVSGSPTPPDPSEPPSAIVRQPQTRAISQEQLIAEVKGIYAGLVMVESKCIEVDNAQKESGKDGKSRLNTEQWQALIALHRTLLHEHHDFFLASQHPSASPALQRLASKYSMPARMWRHGIHSFLELLRHRLPTSLEHMLTFIYLAYSMMALLYETVPAFEDTWIECLGDLGRYRMAIEDDNPQDRENWTIVSRQWYTKASDKQPTTGRLYHHLAILSRPQALQQLFFYSKSLCVATPFGSARESILTLFDPILKDDEKHIDKQPHRLDVDFVKAHAMLYYRSKAQAAGQDPDTKYKRLDVEDAKKRFIKQLLAHRTKPPGWHTAGAYIAVANANASMEYGFTETAYLTAPRQEKEVGDGDVVMGNTTTVREASQQFEDAWQLFTDTFNELVIRTTKPAYVPYLVCSLTFLLYVSKLDHIDVSKYLKKLHWGELADVLTSMLARYRAKGETLPSAEEFPMPEDNRPLPEDYLLRGLIWANILPEDMFKKAEVEPTDRDQERPSFATVREERVVYLGLQICEHIPEFTFGGPSGQERFDITPKYEAHDSTRRPIEEPPQEAQASLEVDSAESRQGSPAGSQTSLEVDSSETHQWDPLEQDPDEVKLRLRTPDHQHSNGAESRTSPLIS